MTDSPSGWSSPDPRASPASPAAPLSGGPSPVASATAPFPGRPQAGVVPLRPLGLGELLDGAVNVVRRYPRPVLAASAAVALVGAVLQLLLALSLRTSVDAASANVANGTADATLNLGASTAVLGLAAALIGIVTGAVLTGLVTAVVGRAVFGQPTSLRDAWATVRPRLVPLILVSFLVPLAAYGVLVVAIGVVALVSLASGGGAIAAGVLLVPLGIVAMVWLYVRWWLAPAAVVLEKQPVRAALRRSKVLVARSFWRVLGILLLASLITSFVGLVLQLPFQLVGLSRLGGFGSSPTSLSVGKIVAGAVVGTAVSTVVAPFAAGVRALVYVDRRMRAEGLDVALHAAAADAAGR